MSGILVPRDLTKRFGGLTAVDALDFSVAEGETFAIIGPNGAGKTTALQLISGLLTPTSGSLSLSGRELAPLPPSDRTRAGLGRAFQVVQPFP